MLRRIMLLRFRADAKPEHIAFWERTSRNVPKQIHSVSAWEFGKLLPEHANGWHHDDDGVFQYGDAVRSYSEHPYHKQNLTSFFEPDKEHRIGEAGQIFLYEPLEQEIHDPAFKGLKRSLHMQLPEGQGAKRFEATVLKTLQTHPTVHNWSFGRVTSGGMGSATWTHALELELPERGDPWFDPFPTMPGTTRQETAYRVSKSILAQTA